MRANEKVKICFLGDGGVGIKSLFETLPKSKIDNNSNHSTKFKNIKKERKQHSSSDLFQIILLKVRIASSIFFESFSSSNQIFFQKIKTKLMIQQYKILIQKTILRLMGKTTGLRFLILLGKNK